MSQKITSYPGREITPDEVKQGKYLDIVYKFEPKYSWAAGVAISRFLTATKGLGFEPFARSVPTWEMEKVLTVPVS